MARRRKVAMKRRGATNVKSIVDSVITTLTKAIRDYKNVELFHQAKQAITAYIEAKAKAKDEFREGERKLNFFHNIIKLFKVAIWLNYNFINDDSFTVEHARNIFKIVELITMLPYRVAGSDIISQTASLALQVCTHFERNFLQKKRRMLFKTSSINKEKEVNAKEIVKEILKTLNTVIDSGLKDELHQGMVWSEIKNSFNVSNIKKRVYTKADMIDSDPLILQLIYNESTLSWEINHADKNIVSIDESELHRFERGLSILKQLELHHKLDCNTIQFIKSKLAEANIPETSNYIIQYGGETLYNNVKAFHVLDFDILIPSCK